MDRFDAMLAFTRVVELNSFTKASLSLDLPKTTVSAYVNALEERLHVKLLHRTTRYVSVTPDGAAFYERAVRILNDVEECEDAVSRMTAAIKGKLRISIPGAFGRKVIVPALPDFFKRYPDIELDVSCTDRQVDLLQEGIDCVIRGGTSVDDSLVARRLESVEMITCASPIYLKEFGTPTKPEDLEAHKIIHFVSPIRNTPYPLSYVHRGTKHETYGHRCISFNDPEACVEASIAGLGVIQASDFLVREALVTGRLVEILKEYPAEKFPVSILYLKNRNQSARVRAFIEWAAEKFSGHAR